MMWTGARLAGIGLALLLAGCDDMDNGNESLEPAEETAALEPEQPRGEGDLPEKQRAVATLESKTGSELTGEAFFVKESDGQVSFGVHVENVSPGTHAVHIHENGDCSAPDASSAGDHWNPTNQPHGKWGGEASHLGDIGNIEVGENGDGTLSLSTDLWSLQESGENGVLGKAVVVHSGADDFQTQPDGAAGERIGCGVIELQRGTPTSEDR